ncbi:putative amidase AmiB2 [Acrocarpospora phusangensis]|uniref:Amidase AmiB2 n=1 Tax=Acrocarpospora phusangensis TaxID=1070424 RepID=A0A919QMW3_9ACTN|nr:putative amidase AmiB2 [Acrocarpospora phusangensis]
MEIAEAVRNGKATVPGVVAEHLAAIEARAASLGAFRKIRVEEAIREARAVQDRPDLAELPLAGVPVAVKDNVEVAGEATRNGSAATPAEPASADHPVVARLRQAGAVVVALTNVPELCLVAFSDSVYGTARNPWNLDRTPGGSSGGSAAAVSAGLVPLAVGNDGLGSLRIPGACCGIIAIKPGFGMVPPPAHDWFEMCENGPLTTTVADAALALRVMAGDQALTPHAADLRIAVTPNPLPLGLSIDKEFQRAVDEAGHTLREAGHTVVPGRRLPTVVGMSSVMTWYSCAAEDSQGLPPAKLERRTRTMAAAGRTVRTLRIDGTRTRDDWRASGADLWFGNADVLVTPTLAHVPPRADRWGRRGLIRNTLVNVGYAPVTAAWNMAGWPAMTVPYGRHSSGLPIGVQLIAPPGAERQLLGLAAQLEAARPWSRHAPGT